MSLKDQLLNYFVCCWQDFWRVSPHKLLSVLGIIFLAVAVLFWRTYSFPLWVKTTDRALSPIITLLMLFIAGYGLYRRVRGLFR